MEVIGSLRRWDALSAQDQEVLAQAIGERLRATFAFASMNTLSRHSVGD